MGKINKMKKLLLIILLFANIGHANSDGKSFLSSFDISYYYPQRHGLKDLSVEIHLIGLTQKLNDQLVFGKLKDVYYELSWKFPDKVKIDILGMPNGFTEIKNQLKQDILLRLDFIVPYPLETRLRGYSIELKEDKNGFSLVCKDPTNMQDANEVILAFSKDKKLERFVVKRPIGLESANLKMSKKSWSKGKLVLDKYMVRKTHGVQTIQMTSDISYETNVGIGLPAKISTSTKQILTQPGLKKSGTYERENKSELVFRNYKVNTGLKGIDFP